MKERFGISTEIIENLRELSLITVNKKDHNLVDHDNWLRSSILNEHNSLIISSSEVMNIRN